MFEELSNYGFLQEIRHFARGVRGKEQPIVTGEDGRVVMEVLCAAYESARTAAKGVRPDILAGKWGLARSAATCLSPFAREQGTGTCGASPHCRSPCCQEILPHPAKVRLPFHPAGVKRPIELWRAGV